jgi:outer membrane receptor protein involved in Fe transport
MFSATLLMEFRSGFSRNAESDHGMFQGRDMSAELGLPSLVTEPEFQDFPKITVLNFAELGTEASQPTQFHTTDMQFNGKLTWVKSKHILKAGMDYSRVRYNQPFFNNQRGTYNFQGRWTNAPMADLLLGLLHSSTRQVGFTRNYWRIGSWGAFVNDDFKATRALTVNLGLRYEIDKSPVDRYDRLMNYVPYLDKIVVADLAALEGLEDVIATAGLTEATVTSTAARR